MRTQSSTLTTPFEFAERVPPGRDLQFPQGGERDWLPAEVPGQVHLDLLRAGVIADPFFRMQERSCQWVDEADWTYRTTFLADAERIGPAGSVAKQFLLFHSLDTFARVYLNDSLLGASENYFTPVRFDVTAVLLAGENRLRIEFDAALRVGRERATAYLADGTSERGAQSYFNFGPRAFVRKPQYMFGWDWGPELISCGISGPIEWITVPVAEIIDWKYDYRFTSESLVDIDIRLTLRKLDDTPLVAGASLFAAGDTTPSALVQGGPGDYTVDLPIRNFRCVRWNPNGSPGAQRRYLLNLKLTTLPEHEDADVEIYDFKGVSIGFRTVELLHEPDADGAGAAMRFRINGRDTFIKGANWIPDGSFPAAIAESRLRQRLTQARDAGMNMLRVWGGGLYESDTFYSLCDELGLLVWQDFGFACSMYPDDLPEFCNSVRAEAVANVRRLRHHPCLALWCGGNENLELAQDRWGGKTQATRFFGDHLIHTLLPSVLADEDPATTYWPNSPYGGEKATSEDYGDSHYWNVWHAKTPQSDGDWIHYAASRSRFSSEFGFAGPAGARAWDTVTIPEDRLSTDSAVSRWHDKTRKGYQTYLSFIEKHYPKLETWDDVLYYGQLNQADALRFGVEHWRRSKGRCWGTLFWQLNDCWPTHSWAVIDSAGDPKAAWYAARRFYAPLLLSLKLDSDSVQIFVINDSAAAAEGTLFLQILGFDGAVIAETSAAIEVEANALANPEPHLAIAVPLSHAGGADRASWLAVATLRGVDGAVTAEAFHLLAEPKNLAASGEVTAAVRSIRSGRAELNVAAPDRFAGGIRLALRIAGHQPVFSDNFFHLLRGQEREISMTGLPLDWDESVLLQNLEIRHLGTARTI